MTRTTVLFYFIQERNRERSVIPAIYDKRVEDITSEGRTATRTKQYAIGGEVAKSTPQSLSKWVDELLVAEEWE